MPAPFRILPTRPLLVAAALALLLCGSLPASAEGAPTPEQATKFITDLSAEVLEILSDTSVPIDQCEKKVRELMDKNVAIDFIARFALGKYWARASEADRADYTALFRRFFLQKYAAMLGGYDNQTVTIENAKPAGNEDMLIGTSIDDNKGGPPIRAGWRIRLFDGRPLIVDIVIEGISMAMNQRQEFNAVLSRQGMSGLLDVLRATTERVPAQSPA